MNKNKTLASQLINQIIEKDFVGAKDSFASLIRQKSLTRLGEKKIEVASRMFVSEARDTSPETLAKIKAADKSYSKMSTQELKKLYQQHYRVSDVSGMSKNNLIGDILRAEFGDKAVDMAFESVEETELEEDFQKNDSVRVKPNVYDSIGKKYIGKSGKISRIDGNYVYVKIIGSKSPEIEFRKSELELIESVEETELDEAAKEMTMKQVMQKVDDGEWEAEQDVKVGKHIMFHDHKGKRFVIYITEEIELDEAKNKLSDLEPMEQFELINDYLGIRQSSGVKHFRTDPNRAEDIIKANSVDADKVKDAIERMKKDKRLDNSFTLSEDFLNEANKLSDLSSMQQFQLLNDYLGLRMHGAIRQFRDNPDFVKKAIADHKIDSKTLEAALEKMKKDGNLDRNFKLNEDADLLDEAYVDRFAKKRKENGSELKDWTMKKLDMFRDMPHGSYTNKEIQQEYQRRIKTGEYVKA